MKLGPFFLPLTFRQLLFYILLGAGIVLFFLWDWKVCYTLLTFMVCGFYGLIVVFRLVSVILALAKNILGRPDEHVISADEIRSLDQNSLPIYTILVPMYKEPEVAQKIARAVTELDYPIDKLDVKLLLEEDDPDTRGKIMEVFDQLPPCVEVMVCPKVGKNEPRTKPRACNWGLERARGEYLVIYDAEDRPEPDQLKKAILAFRHLAQAGRNRVVCLQAKLNYFNARQNGLTRFFTLEYSSWFDLFLPGLHAFRIPIPLGGTSNHFKMDILRELGGWDPFNVTEDCDLGIRMARKRYVTEVLDSTTWEEATSRVGNWIRQRSRWIKGYFQTHFVHTRDSFWPALGLSIFFALFCMLLSSDMNNPSLQESHEYTSLANAASMGLCAACAGLFLWGAAERLMNGDWRRYREGRLRSYDSLTFRLTVGGHSSMLLLNMLFWLLSGIYLLHEPVAQALPAFTDQCTLNGETPRQLIGEWTLFYAKVTEDRFEGLHLWNTGYAWIVDRTLSWDQVKQIFGAIDVWSFWSQILYPVVIGLFIANFVFVLLGLASCWKRRFWDLIPFALLTPFYWILISIAAFKGFWQLFWNPWYWEKTHHGFAQPPSEVQPVAESTK